MGTEDNICSNKGFGQNKGPGIRCKTEVLQNRDATGKQLKNRLADVHAHINHITTKEAMLLKPFDQDVLEGACDGKKRLRGSAQEWHIESATSGVYRQGEIQDWGEVCTAEQLGKELRGEDESGKGILMGRSQLNWREENQSLG